VKRPERHALIIGHGKVRRPDARPLLHRDEALSHEVLDQAFGDDFRHELIGVVDALAPLA
jgi:hypothetical protein